LKYLLMTPHMQRLSPGDASDGAGKGPGGFLSGNKAFIVVWLALLITMAGLGMVSPLLPNFAQDMGASGIWIALIFCGYVFTQVPLMPLVGRLSDRYGKKLFLWLGLLIYVMAAAGYYWSPGYREIFLFRLLAGVGAAMVVPTAYAYVGDLAPRGQEGRYMGLFNIAFVAGLGVGPTMGGLIYDRFGLHATFASMGILSAAGFLVVLLFLPGRRPSRRGGQHDEPGASFASLLKDGTMRGIIVLQLVQGLAYGAVATFLPIFMTDVRGTSIAAVGVVLSVRYILNGSLAYPFGWLADRMNRVFLVTVGVAVMATGIFFVPWVGGFIPILCLFIVLGIFETVALPAGNAITVERGRILGMGGVMAVFNMANSSAVVVGSMGGALIEDSFGLAWVFRCVAAASLAGMVVFNVFMRRLSR
jgi:MFS transporter, DHA1 family, multidrug resistance protein